MKSKVVYGSLLALLFSLGFSVFAHAEGKPYKDEVSNGTLYDPKVYANCDIRALVGEVQSKSLLVTVGVRGRQEFPNTSLYINTRGGVTSDPEFVVDGSGHVSMPGNTTGPNEVRASVWTVKRGKQIVFRVPLTLIKTTKKKKIGVQAKTCGEGAVDIAPGSHFFNDLTFNGEIPHRYLTASVADRVISGRVLVECVSFKSSCRRMPVNGAKVTAVGGSPKRTYVTQTDEKGSFELGVKKGTYNVRANAGRLKIAEPKKSVNVKRRKAGTASFEGCGLSGASASASAVTGGVWKGGNEDCLNYLEVSWRPSSHALTLNWVSAPICTGAGGNWVGAPKMLMKGRLIDTSKAGQAVDVNASTVGFFYPIGSPHSGNNVNGELRANGTGKVNAKYIEGLCTYSISNLGLKR